MPSTSLKVRPRRSRWARPYRRLDASRCSELGRGRAIGRSARSLSSLAAASPAGAAVDVDPLGSVEKSRSGIAAGVLNATRQTGSVLGVALFGSPASQADALQAGAHASLAISAGLLLVGGAAIWWGVVSRRRASVMLCER